MTISFQADYSDRFHLLYTDTEFDRGDVIRPIPYALNRPDQEPDFYIVLDGRFDWAIMNLRTGCIYRDQFEAFHDFMDPDGYVDIELYCT